MTLGFDLFWSFRSPYSYLATGRIVGLARTHRVDVRVRPVYPLAVRVPDFFQRVNPLWPAYVFRDTTRIAQMLGLPFHWPRPDPIVQDMKTGAVARQQPYIHRLTRLGAAAERRGRGLAFIDAVSQLIWSGEVAGWNDGEHLAKAAASAGLDLAELEAAIAGDVERYEAIISENEQAHAAAGHWGVPTMVFEGEPFFGQDRIDALTWRLQQRGLEARS
ncbi:MAG: 2-hydroxychromene-2-carboxylate isomerase [Myxococcota bacterium]